MMQMDGPSIVKVNRLKDSYTWNVQVAAENSSLAALREAKDKALALAQEFESELNAQDPKARETEVPY